MVAVAAEEQNAHGFFLPAKLQCPLDFVAIFVQIVHMQGVGRSGDAGLDIDHHLAEQFVEGTFDNDQHRVHPGLLQLFRVDIQLKAALFHGLQNGLPSLLTDVRMVIQDTGYSSNGVAGLGSKIFDGHGYTSLITEMILETYQ